MLHSYFCIHRFVIFVTSVVTLETIAKLSLMEKPLGNYMGKLSTSVLSALVS